MKKHPAGTEKQNQGLTLVEVVAAMAIISLALIAVMQAMSMGSQAAAFSRERTVAAFLVQRKLEEVKARDFSANVTEGPTSFPGFSEYSLWVTQVVNWDSNQYLKMVEAGINWADASGMTQSESVRTLISDK